MGNNSKSNDKGCRICKEEGHFARECPKKGEDRPKRGCFKCGEEGHSKADCPNEAKDGGGDKRGCFKCKGDHMASECELPDTCRKCKKEGHMAADCEEPDKCRFCGEEGHKAGDCTGAKTHEVTKEDGTKHEIYIPSELTDDKLFDQGINQGINFDKFDNIKMKIGGENAPNPISAFEKMGLRQIVLDNIKKSGYKKPTPIQKIAIHGDRLQRDFKTGKMPILVATAVAARGLDIKGVAHVVIMTYPRQSMNTFIELAGLDAWVIPERPLPFLTPM